MMLTNNGSKLMCRLAVLLCFGVAVASQAQAQKIGDWELTTLTISGIRPHLIASTAGSRAGTELVIRKCDAYEVRFQLVDDPEFDAQEAPDVSGLEKYSGARRMIFQWHEGSNPSLDPEFPEPVIIADGEDPWNFSSSIAGALLAKSTRFCPTANSIDRRCLRFSLVGFNEALRRVCASQRLIWSRR